MHSVVPVTEAEEKAGYPLELIEQIEALSPAERRSCSRRRLPALVGRAAPEVRPAVVHRWLGSRHAPVVQGLLLGAIVLDVAYWSVWFTDRG